MTEHANIPAGSAVRGTAAGVLFMAIFGTLWSYTGILGLRGWMQTPLLVAAAIIGILLVSGGVGLIRASRQLPDEIAAGDAGQGRRIRFWFNIVFTAEGIGIAIAIAVCNAIGRIELIPILIALIVGVHFFPLASLFRVKRYHATGALLCLIAVMAWLFMPAEMTLDDQAIDTYMTVVGGGSALILWGTSLSIWLTGRRLAATARR